MSSLLSIFQSAISMLEIGMIFPRQGHPSMEATPCLSLKWGLLAWAARSCLSSASHFFGLRSSPSRSEIFNRRRISFLNSGMDKFLGRLGKIEGFFISNPCKRHCLHFKQFRIFLLILLLKYGTQHLRSLYA